ncbi:MAG: pyridoxal-phosphate dependent enzyme [Alphaproteobacteria bacterium]|nr:MAG: pyridoxal-phosphate dependent enzyme [Alphaproteobacteria bacterium]
MTSSLVIQPEVIDRARRRAAIESTRAAGVILPCWRQLADPSLIPPAIESSLQSVAPDAASEKNLWRVHWFNRADRREKTAVPGHIVLPQALTGVKTPIVVLFGRRFPMIGAHKVLAAYACLIPRLVTGGFDPRHDRAVWPSTGNYCRGGVAISRIVGCRGVAVLPAGMSRERFEWLAQWVADPADIIRTPGTESNVKEIYDKCAELARDSKNVIFNQFSQFANYLIHYYATGAAFDCVFSHLKKARAEYRLAAFVSATGSAGTIAAGDYLKSRHGSRTVAVEAIECPTMLCNGYGEHNIQGIGDKHIPLIHNVMSTDVVVGVSDLASDSLNVLFGGNIGRSYLAGRRKIDADAIAAFDDIGISGLANIVAAIKLAKHLDLGADDVIMTVATDSALLYASERQSFLARRYRDGFDEVNAGEIFSRHLEGIVDDHVVELTHLERKRIFNLGYFTWVEQQGVALEDFDRRKDRRFWQDLVDSIPAWDRLIEEFNAEVGAGRAH